MRYLTVLFLTAALAGIASADITGFEIQYPDNTVSSGLYGTAGVPTGIVGYHTSDLVMSCDTDWLSAVMLVTPDEPGTIYQDLYGGGLVNEQSPNPMFIPVFPALEYDTCISSGTFGGACGVAAAVDFGDPGQPHPTDPLADPLPVFGYGPPFAPTPTNTPSDRLAISWFTVGTETGDLLLARITMLAGTTGQWTFRATASPEGGPVVELLGLPIVDGYLVPEPATLGLLAIGGLGVLIRRKR